MIIVVKLAGLHGKDENTLYRAYADPKLPPKEIDTPDELIEWLLSADAQPFRNYRGFCRCARRDFSQC